MHPKVSQVRISDFIIYSQVNSQIRSDYLGQSYQQSNLPTKFMTLRTQVHHSPSCAPMLPTTSSASTTRPAKLIQN